MGGEKIKNWALKKYYDKKLQPFIDEHGIDALKERLYLGIYPLGYSNGYLGGLKRMEKALNGYVVPANLLRDDIYAEYLQIPQEKRRGKPSSKISNSNYKPTMGDNNTVYKRVPLRKFYLDEFITEGINNLNKSINSTVLKDYFGTHTIGRGFDDKGDYISYYDKWDLAPLGGSNVDDQTQGVGKPVEFYDRIYLDDYYDIPEEARGNPFITPAVVTAYKKGGRIHIKKKNRGKFTEYCGGKVTEECIAKGKKSKDPKIRKRATFASNNRRWKHENGGIIRFQPGGTVKLDDYGYPADITPAIVTQDSEFNKFLMTLPDNLRLTPEKDYHMYDYWKLSGKPENFKEGKRRGMFTWDNSDKGYHAGSIAEDRNTGIYHFMKPKHHPTVKYELDWFNKGLQTLEGGKQVPVEGKDKEFWKDFTSKYQLDTTGVDYRYVPIKKNGGILKALDYANYITKKPAY